MDLHLLTFHKEGFFVVVQEKVVCDKSLASTEKSSGSLCYNPAKVKEEALSLLRGHNLEQLA